MSNQMTMTGSEQAYRKRANRGLDDALSRSTSRRTGRRISAESPCRSRANRSRLVVICRSPSSVLIYATGTRQLAAVLPSAPEPVCLTRSNPLTRTAHDTAPRPDD